MGIGDTTIVVIIIIIIIIVIITISSTCNLLSPWHGREVANLTLISNH
jgi:hypothetical protein